MTCFKRVLHRIFSEWFELIILHSLTLSTYVTKLSLTLRDQACDLKIEVLGGGQKKLFHIKNRKTSQNVWVFSGSFGGYMVWGGVEIPLPNLIGLWLMLRQFLPLLCKSPFLCRINLFKI